MKSPKHLFAITTTLALCCGISPSHAQTEAFEKGTSAVNLGIGIGGVGYGYLSYYNNVSASPVFNASYELGVAKLGPGVLGVGAMVGHSWRTSKYVSHVGNSVYNYDYRWTTTSFGVRAQYHLNWFHGMEKLDLYGGVFTGLAFTSSQNRSTYRNSAGVITDHGYNHSNPGTGFRSGAFVGARWLFSNNFGVFSEFGYSVAYLNVGLTLKF